MSVPLAHPEWLEFLAALVLGFGLALGAGILWARRRARALLGPGAEKTVRGLGLDLTLLAALLGVGIALLGPQLGERSVWVPTSGVDVALLVDVSRSMLARDVPPSRLDRARETARRLLEGLAPGDRAALAVFAGRGVLLTPLTPDKAALVEMLPALDPDLMQEQGSHIEAGVRAALEAFEARSRRPRVVFLLSDGERTPTRDRQAEPPLARAGVRVIAAAFGSETGTTVPYRGAALRDARDRVVISQRKLDPLARLAEMSGGNLLLANAFGSIDADEALRLVRRDAGRVAGEPVERRVPITWVAPFAGVAFVLLGLELAGATWRRRRRSALAATLAIALGAGAAAATDPDARPLLEARVRRNPGDARALLALGVARAESGEQDEAARALFAAAARARDPMLAARAYYDLGVVEIERGELEAARDAFYDALALHPEDREAKFNLEWTLRALGATPPPAPEDGAAAKPPPQVEPSEPDAVTPGEDGPQPNEVDSVRRGPEPARAEDPFAPAPLPSLSQAEAERWLEVVVDDPRRSLRDAVRSAGAGAPIVSRGTPQW